MKRLCQRPAFIAPAQDGAGWSFVSVGVGVDVTDLVVVTVGLVVTVVVTVGVAITDLVTVGVASQAK